MMTNEEAADRLTQALIQSVIGVDMPKERDELADADDCEPATETTGVA